MGEVIVSLLSDEDYVCLKIADNGKGIPKSILSKIGAKGETYGKKNGHGLGLYHARKIIELWGGNFNIESEVDRGTEVILRLPKSSPPKIFISKLEVKRNTKIVVIDDDQSIHQIWQGRFDSLIKLNNVEIVHFTDPNEFLNYNMHNRNIDFYLIDYEFIGHKINGLDLIKMANINSKSILVTSRFEEEQIIKLCENDHIKLLPKGLAAFVPIKFKDTDTKKRIASILLDDDDLVRLIWTTRAKQNNINLDIFSEPYELMNNLNDYSPECVFYVDSDLSNNQKGEDVVEKLYSMGFTDLHMATGYESEKFSHLTYLKSIMGKQPPW